MYKDLLPVGSIVLLKGGKKKTDDLRQGNLSRRIGCYL